MCAISHIVQWMCKSEFAIRDQADTAGAIQVRRRPNPIGRFDLNFNQGLLSFYGTMVSACWLVALVYHLLNSIWEDKYAVRNHNQAYAFVQVSAVWRAATHSHLACACVPHFCTSRFCCSVTDWPTKGWVLIPVPLTITMFAGDWATAESGWVVFPSMATSLCLKR